MSEQPTTPDEGAAALLREEALRLRDAQDRRLDDLRNRSALGFTLVSAALVFAAAVGAIESPPVGAVIAGAIGFGGMVLCVIEIHVPRGGFTEGPNVEVISGNQLAQGTNRAELSRDLARLHFSDYQGNNETVCNPVGNWFIWSVVSAGLVVGAVLYALLA